MKRILSLLIIVSTFFSSCNDEPSLQKYFVEKTENKNFIALDLSPSMLNVDSSKLSSEENEALRSFEKVNILAFKKDGKNNSQYTKEIKEVKEILKDTVYQPLIKLNGVGQNASIMIVGDNKEIDELILFGNKKELGFTVVRVLGNDMKPENAMEFLSILQKSNIDMEQLKPILNFVNKK